MQRSELGLGCLAPMASPNPYEASFVKRQITRMSGLLLFFRFPGPGRVPDARGVTTPDDTGRNPPCAGAAASGLCRGRYAHADTACLHSITWGHSPRLSVLAASSRLRSL